MKGWKSLKDFFRLTKKDRVGLWVMTIIILLLFVLPDLPQAEAWLSRQESDTAWMAEWRVFLDTMQKKAASEINRERSSISASDAAPTPHSLFPFDPNTLPEEGWKKLGLRYKTIQTILNYRNKGGVFRKPEDLSRVYGLFPDEYERLKPFIDIPVYAPALSKDTAGKNAAYSATVARSKVYAVDINAADSAAWEALPGIGPRLAQRILRFRDALGGFHSVEQVAETFGLADSTFQKVRPYLLNSNLPVKTININEVTAAELSQHPYFSKSMAGRIVAYREQHGHFKHTEDLRRVMGVSDSLMLKWKRYLH